MLEDVQYGRAYGRIRVHGAWLECRGDSVTKTLAVGANSREARFAVHPRSRELQISH